ncbi:unannotated protein [freshwater metagenome]|uniref:Unannotated protein n=1 Tax=freshwater metagenome TaxID=449393 RepID=A0A6J6XQ70_9ZZZZ|nr:hypothetical protein [Actinomycetota bacterium]MSV86523.1 hypothetical protein [Actinomycetota bacterium]MSW67712.1 hypothetical protein [Actinomycetota bacterium]MSY03201.1 hypothetical protein [Actinomycetota bacterium]MSY20450.1 hypothetical protein [Actinomycetota bacterium]
MFQRVLWVSLTQALRSIALLVLPISFLTLLAWSTAGSSTANTADPIRVALWLWLACHHIPFSLLLPPAEVPGFLSYLPLGALIFPFIVLRKGYRRVINHIDIGEQSIRLARSLFTGLYSLCVTLIAWLAQTQTVKPVFYWAPLIVAAGTWLTTGTVVRKKRSTTFVPVDLAFRLMAVVLGISSLALGISLIAHLSVVKNLTLVLQPGLLGGLLLLLINILFIPNVIVATLSYFVGSGFAIGAGTIISPWSHTIAEIPALPILGALPTGRHPMALVSIIILVAMGIVLYNATISQNQRVVAQSFVVILLSALFLSFMSSGALLTSSLNSVGVSIWKFPLLFSLEIGTGIVLGMFAPRLLERVSAKNLIRKRNG